MICPNIKFERPPFVRTDNSKNYSNRFQTNTSTKLRQKWYKCKLNMPSLSEISEDTVTKIVSCGSDDDNDTASMNSQFSETHTESNYSTESSYSFFCKNVSTNLLPIIGQINPVTQELHDFSLFDRDRFDVHQRIIPEYYIKKTDIKIGALNFNFYDSIIDSIRNMRELSPHQMAFIEKCSTDEYMEIITEYNAVIKMLKDIELDL